MFIFVVLPLHFFLLKLLFEVSNCYINCIFDYQTPCKSPEVGIYERKRTYPKTCFFLDQDLGNFFILVKIVFSFFFSSSRSCFFLLFLKRRNVFFLFSSFFSLINSHLSESAQDEPPPGLPPRPNRQPWRQHREVFGW